MIEINNRDLRPVYEQIKDGLRKLIVSGVYSANERLPSVRELAEQLAINPNTIQRAYRELEQEGYICSRQGRGAFVNPYGDVEDYRKETLFRTLRETIQELRFLGVEESELIVVVKDVNGVTRDD